MNQIKNILKTFENSEQASVHVSYCSVDDLFTVILKHGSEVKIAENTGLEFAFGDIIEYVQALKGDI